MTRIVTCVVLLLLWSHSVFASMAIDGSVTTNTTTGNAYVVSLTTTQSNDVIIVMSYSFSSAGNVSSISDTTGLTWHKRQAGATGGSLDYDEWYAIAASPLSADSITITYGAAPNERVAAFGISGANTSVPFDPNVSLPAQSNSGSSNVSTLSVSSISTNTSSDMLITSLRGLGSLPTLTRPSGFSAVLTGGSSTDFAYDVVSSTLSSATETYSWTGGAQQASMMFDAVQAAGTGGPSVNVLLGVP